MEKWDTVLGIAKPVMNGRFGYIQLVGNSADGFSITAKINGLRFFNSSNLKFATGPPLSGSPAFSTFLFLPTFGFSTSLATFSKSIFIRCSDTCYRDTVKHFEKRC